MEGCWKRPLSEKSSVVEVGLPGALGCTAQPPHWRETGISARGRGVQLAAPAPIPQPPQTPACHPWPALSVLVLTCPYPCCPDCTCEETNRLSPLRWAPLLPRFLNRPSPLKGVLYKSCPSFAGPRPPQVPCLSRNLLHP